MSGQPPPAGGMSLYANLLEPKTADSSASISRAPVLFKQAGDADSSASKKPLDPATLRFQPIRRPQPAQKQKPKATFPKAPAPTVTPATAAAAVAGPTATATANAEPEPAAAHPPAASGPPAPPAQGRSTLADWVATEEDEYVYGTTEKRQRGGRRQKKKKGRRDEDERTRQTTDWDELYDPARPTNIEEYLRSDERLAEIREWKGVLYAHRRRRQRRSTSSRSSDDDEAEHAAAGMNRFAPPPSYSFAPPPPSPPRPVSQEPASTSAPDDATGDDAYARRLALSGMATAAPPRSQGPEQSPPNRAPSPTTVAGPSDASGTISRAAVHYEQPRSGPDEMDVDEDGADYEPPTAGLGATAGDGEESEQQEQEPRSSRPGQPGFAARMMSKMGWQKGSGLGAEGSGIVTGLSVQVEKRRRRADAEGGGFAEPAGKGRIVGGKRAAGAGNDPGRFGRMSEVVLLRGMLDDMQDLASEVADGLGQEIGEECGEKYGRVERLYIDVENRQVFIKFTDQVSALRAVNALDGRVFNGNTIVPSFYDSEKFEDGAYT